MKRLITILAAVSLFVICACLGIFFVSTFATTPATATPRGPVIIRFTPTALPRAPYTVTTSKDVINVPGSAYLDGRDFEAQPPLTINEINLYTRHGPDFSPRVCDRPHAHPVQVLSAVEVDDRYWFQVDAGDGCIGWLLDSLIGPTAEPPIGDEFP